MILDLSLGEFTALTGKAFRGAGYPWGLSNDGAYAAGVLAQHGLPAADIVARLLTVVERSGVDTFLVAEARAFDPDEPQLDPGVCPVCLGVALSDLGRLETDELAATVGSRAVLEPILLAPWLTNCRVDWEQGHAVIDPSGIRMTGVQPTAAATITITALDERGTGRRPASDQLSTRAPVARPAFKKLLSLAARTYAPATDESRRGAGGDSV